MIDNLELIKPLLTFESKDDFYFLQILQRKKENPDIGSNSKVIKNYHITSLDYLNDKYDEIKTLCNTFNARASLRLNKRSFERIAFKTLENFANLMQTKEYKHIVNCYDKACGQSHNEKEKKWIVDVDKNELIWLEQIINAFQEAEPNGNKIIIKLPTKSGIHIITKPFNIMQFKDNLKNELYNYTMGEIIIDIHKDNPINLYIP